MLHRTAVMSTAARMPERRLLSIEYDRINAKAIQHKR